jgi:hypothetical protein
VAERIEEILEHHRDQGLVFDDEDGARCHGADLGRNNPQGNKFFEVRRPSAGWDAEG